MHPVVLIAQESSGYWLAGILTVIAAAIVTVIILLSSRSNVDGR